MSDQSTAHNSDHQAKLERVLAEYLHSVEQGQPFDRQALVAANPDLADDLQSFFHNRDSMNRLAEPLKAAVDAPTLLSSLEAAPAQSGITVRYFGDYELLDEIARGGMGVVYKARQVNLNRTVALKMILAGQLANDSDVKRFYAEAEAAARLDHPGIVPIFEIGQHDGQHYFSMAFIEGESLAKRITNSPLPPRDAAEMLKKVADAVEFAHQKGIIHRDLKPANVLLDAKGQPKVTDFGLAKQTQGDSGLTGSGQILGTPSYMPPEQAAGRMDQVGPTADVYSLGAILYCLVTGRPPFQAASPIDTLRQVVEQEPVPPRQLNPLVPLDLETIALKCLEKEPHRRYAKAAELAEELSRFLRGEPILARPVGTVERTWRWCKRNRQVAGLLVTVACLLIAGIALTSSLARVANLNAENSDRNARAAASERDRANEASEVALREQRIAEEQRQVAIQQQKIAERERDLASRNLYVANMHLARQAWESSEITHLQELLRRSEPQQGQHDLRGWEWEFLKSQSRSVVSLSGHALEISAVVWSPDGRRLASSAAPASAEFGELKIWDTDTGKELFALGGRTEYGISAIAWSPDGKRLAAGGGKTAGFRNVLPGELKIWDAETGREVLKITGHLGKVNSATFSPDGGRLASAAGEFGPPGQAKVWDLESGRELLDLRGHENQVNSIVWNPDGTRLATASANGAIKIFNAETGMALHTLQIALACNAAIWSPDGQLLATRSADEIVRIWDPSNGTMISEIPTTAGASRTFLADCQWLADSERLSWIDARGAITTWNLKTGMPIETTVSHIRNVRAAAWSPDHARLALAGSDQTIKISDETLLPDALIIEASGIVALSPDGKRLATAKSDVRISDMATGQQIQVWPWPPDWNVMAVAWSPDGKRLISSSVQSFPGGLKMWDVEAEKELCAWQGHIGPPFAVAWSPDGARLATAGMDKLVKVWDASAPTIETGKLEGHTGIVMSVDWHPDGNRLASVGADGIVKLWDLTDANKTRTLAGHSGMARSVAWSPLGERVASAGVDGVKIWDANSGELLSSLRGHSDMVLAIAWQPASENGSLRLASVSLDGTLKLWDVESGQEVLTLRNKVPFLSVAWTPDGKQLVAGSASGTKIWNAGIQPSRKPPDKRDAQ